jgi:putative NADPH-quinone reductase
MKMLEIVCNPRRPSLGATLAREVGERLTAAGHELLYHDLYDEGFDPVLTDAEVSQGFSLDTLVQAHCRDLALAGGIVVIHPDWWSQPPALLKGWVDRVFRQGIAYDLVGGEFGEKSWKGLLGGKKALVLCSSDNPRGEGRSVLEDFWVDSVFGVCGIEARCEVLRGLRASGSGDRRDWVESALRLVGEYFPNRAGAGEIA